MNFDLTRFSGRKAYFLFLLPVFFVLHGYVQNYPTVPVSDAIRVTVVFGLSILVLLVFFFFIFRSWQKSALFSFALMCIEFFFGAFHDLLKTLFGSLFITKYSFILPVIFLVLLLFFLLLLKTKKEFLKLGRYLNLVLLVLILLDAMSLLYKGTRKNPGRTVLSAFQPCDTCRRPNIYFIIVDEYAGLQELKDVFSFDNSAFPAALSKRGFLAIRRARSNYNYTPFSMASTLSMDYLKEVSQKSNDIHNRNVCYEKINHNDLVDILGKLGYDFVNLSLFDFAGQPTWLNNDRFYSTHEKIITSQTLTARLKKDLSYNLLTTFHFDWAIRSYHRDLIDHIRIPYQQTLAIASKPLSHPTFIYTHFIMPHYPYLYDRKGNLLPFEEALQAGRKDLYLGYLQYCNQMSLAMVDSIVKYDQSRPMVILMSDHGFTKYGPEYNPAYNFQNMINIYLPDRNYAAIPDSMTNVNLFRILLNTQFHQQLPLLKDSSIFLKEY
ncbi:MAG: hypothetical protein ACXVMS_00305 [Flavisolibacter sp.]